MRGQLDEVKKLKREHKPANVWREVLDEASVKAEASLPESSNVVALPHRLSQVEAAARTVAALKSVRAKAPAKSEEPVQLTDAEKAERRERRKRLAAIPLAEWTKDERLFALGFDGGRWGDAPLDDDVSWLCGPRLTRANHA
jgi:hypothetical protein